MQFETDRNTLLASARIAAKIAPAHHIVDTLKGVLLEADGETGELWLTATNGESTVRQKTDANVRTGGGIIVNARMFADMLSLLRCERVRLHSDRKGSTTITGDTCIYRINHIGAEAFPVTETGEAVAAGKLSEVCALARKTTFVIRDGETSPVMQCVQLVFRDGGVRAAGTGTCRAILTKGRAEPERECEILVPAAALGKLAQVSQDTDTYEVAQTDSCVRFEREGLTFTAKKNTTGKFVDTEGIIGKIKPTHAAIVDADAIRKALDLASVSAAAGRKTEPTTVTLSEGKILLKCTNEASNAEIGVEAEVSNKQDKGFGYNAAWLSQAFGTISGKAKILVDGRGSLLIKAPAAKPESVYIQMPIHTPGGAEPEGSNDGDGQGEAAA